MAVAKYKKGKDGYFSTRVWDGTYTQSGKKHYKHLRSKKSSKDLERKVKELEYQVTFPKAIPIAELALNFTLPLEFGGRKVRFDSGELELPATPAENPTLGVMAAVRRLTLPLDDGILSVETDSPVSVCIMDNRKFQQYDY